MELRRYFTSQHGYRLHQAIWEYHHGPIPPGHHIHHRDENTLNNAIENLECLSSADHFAAHWTEERREQARQQIKRARKAADAWHRTEAGIAWHRELGKRSWVGREPVAKTCIQCGTEFQSITLREDDRYCSNNCKSAWRRASGIDDVERTCEVCGTKFTINRHRKTKTCSRLCAGRLTQRTKRSGL